MHCGICEIGQLRSSWRFVSQHTNSLWASDAIWRSELQVGHHLFRWWDLLVACSQRQDSTLANIVRPSTRNNLQWNSNQIQCGVVITRSIFSKYLQKTPPKLARYGEVWGVFSNCGFSIWLIFCLSSCNQLCSILYVGPFYNDTRLYNVLHICKYHTLCVPDISVLPKWIKIIFSVE